MNAIMQSTRAGKDMISGLSGREASLYAGLSQVPLLLTSLLGIAERFPAFSTTISNVPGPRKQLYWNGAPLIGMYPASAIFHGFALNITLVSYHQNLDFGIVACRRSVPQVQRLIDYLEEALAELEEMAGI
jgi:diacylglycerol O-acyltransferase